MFSHITMKWKAKPLESLEVIINLIENSTIQKELMIKTKANKNEHEKRIKIDDIDNRNVYM